MTMLATRAAQAALAVRIWDTLKKTYDQATATALFSQAILADATAAGQAFAALAPNGPTLAHFSTILDRWQEGGALTIENIHQHATSLSFTVTACRYAQSYHAMGLDPALGTILSCFRDAPFAQGYSPCLTMHRACTIMDGAPTCQFIFTWQDSPASA